MFLGKRNIVYNKVYYNRYKTWHLHDLIEEKKNGKKILN